MDILGYLSAWRRRWVTVVATFVLGIGCAAALSAVTQPQFVSTAQLFVTTTGGASVVEAYQGNLFGEERVVSYANLAAGAQVAQRAVEQLQIDMPASALMSAVAAEPVPDTVLLNISVSDPDPELATDLANAVALQTTQVVEELETSVRGGSPAATAALVHEAQIPAMAAVPNWTRNLLVGALAGLFFGLVAAVVRDKLDGSVRTPQGAADAAGAGLAGTIPGGGGADGDTAGIPFAPAQPATAEAFRVLRANVLAAGGQSETGALVVAGASSGVGATTVSLGLAAAIAETGRSVVLVDADLRERSAS
ncbi:MAG: Wzz/FepE/Etk N-terminal domain-containing protein, partial [Mycobacterium sp.]